MTLEFRLSLAVLVCSGALGLACASGEMVGTGGGGGGSGSNGSGKGGSSQSTSGGGGSGNPQGGGGSTFTGNGGSPGTTGAGGSATTGAGGTPVTTGSGGTSGGFMSSCIPTTALISDMEDGHAYYSSNGCPGSWYLFTSGGGTITVGTAGGAVMGSVTPVAVSDNTPSTMAIHVAGSGQMNTTATSYDAAVSLSASLDADMAHNASTAGSINATQFQGVKFQMKLSAGALGVHLQVSDADTDPAGGRCTSGASQCSDHAFMALTPSTTWTQVMVPFSGLTMQEGFGNKTTLGAGFPKTAIYQILWKVMIPATGPTPAWDIWIDNLSFY